MTLMAPKLTDANYIEIAINTITDTVKNSNDIYDISKWFLDAVQLNYSSFDKFIDEELVLHSIDFANRAHCDRFRDSKDMELVHPMHVGYVVSYWGRDPTTFLAAMLHDTAEDGILHKIYEEPGAWRKYANMEPRDRGIKILQQIKKEFSSYESIHIPKLFDILIAVTTYDRNKDTRDPNMYGRIKMRSELPGGIDVGVTKMADNIPNLITLPFMKAKNGFTAKDRQYIFARTIHRYSIPIAEEIDRRGIINMEIKPYLESLVDRYMIN